MSVPQPGGLRKHPAEAQRWRKRPSGESPEGIEQGKLLLDEWITKQGYLSKDSEFDLIYVNGDNDDTWKVRLIEEDFLRLMFEIGRV